MSNPEYCSYFTLQYPSRRQFTYSKNIRLLQLVHGIIPAFLIPCPSAPTRSFIGSVLRRISKVQMLRFYTRRGVACMQDVSAVRDWADPLAVCFTVRFQRRSTRTPYSTVPVFIDAAKPDSTPAKWYGCRIFELLGHGFPRTLDHNGLLLSLSLRNSARGSPSFSTPRNAQVTVWWPC